MKNRFSLLCALLLLVLAAKSLLSFSSFQHVSQNPKTSRHAARHDSVFILNDHGRLLALNSPDIYDDSVLFGEIEGTNNGSFEDQARMTEINSQVLSFQSGFDGLRQKLETFRRYSPAVIPDDIRVAALNAYIENAIIMQTLGVLDEDDEESENEVFEDYYASAVSGRKRKARKVARSSFVKISKRRHGARRKLNRAIKKLKRRSSNKVRRALANQKRKLFSNPLAERPVGLGEQLDRGNSLEFGEFNVQQAESSGPFVDRFNRERRLNGLNSIGNSSFSSYISHGVAHSSGSTKRVSLDRPYIPSKPVKALHHRRPERLTAIQRIRQGDELLELARQGTLFNFDMDSIYNIPKEDVERYWSTSSKRKVKI